MKKSMRTILRWPRNYKGLHDALGNPLGFTTTNILVPTAAHPQPAHLLNRVDVVAEPWEPRKIKFQITIIGGQSSEHFPYGVSSELFRGRLSQVAQCQGGPCEIDIMLGYTPIVSFDLVMRLGSTQQFCEQAIKLTRILFDFLGVPEVEKTLANFKLIQETWVRESPNPNFSMTYETWLKDRFHLLASA
jgi:hypothetical protein